MLKYIPLNHDLYVKVIKKDTGKLTQPYESKNNFSIETKYKNNHELL